MITAEILKRSLVNFHYQEAVRHKFIIYAMRQRERADILKFCYRKKSQIDGRCSCACHVINNEFRNNIAKATDFLTML